MIATALLGAGIAIFLPLGDCMTKGVAGQLIDKALILDGLVVSGLVIIMFAAVFGAL
ncbi:MAG: hypothetical protein QXH32_02055 [Candidatus Caldarchaeum sp.]